MQKKNIVIGCLTCSVVALGLGFVDVCIDGIRQRKTINSLHKTIRDQRVQLDRMESRMKRDIKTQKEVKAKLNKLIQSNIDQLGGIVINQKEGSDND